MDQSKTLKFGHEIYWRLNPRFLDGIECAFNLILFFSSVAGWIIIALALLQVPIWAIIEIRRNHKDKPSLFQVGDFDKGG